jgi:hypothetical protein
MEIPSSSLAGRFTIPCRQLFIRTPFYPNAHPLVVDGRCTGSYTSDLQVGRAPLGMMGGTGFFVFGIISTDIFIIYPINYLSEIISAAAIPDSPGTAAALRPLTQ